MNRFGPVVVALNGQVFRYDPEGRRLILSWEAPQVDTDWESGIDAIADLDGDGVSEVLIGARVYDGATGMDKTPSELRRIWPHSGGLVALADLDGDRLPEIVVTGAPLGNYVVVSAVGAVTNRVVLEPLRIGEGTCGAPTIVDVDLDGVPEIAVASNFGFLVLALKCMAEDPARRPAECAGAQRGVLWRAEIQDPSARTSSVAFDLNGDGAPELIHRDECWLRVFAGRDGTTLMAANVTSVTAKEGPIVADVDGDGHAEIVVGSDDQRGQASRSPTSRRAHRLLLLVCRIPLRPRPPRPVVAAAPRRRRRRWACWCSSPHRRWCCGGAPARSRARPVLAVYRVGPTTYVEYAGSARLAGVRADPPRARRPRYDGA